MKKYAVIDIKDGDIFGSEKLFDTFEEAEKAADKEYSYLTDHDKSRREAFYIAYGEIDESGCMGDHDSVKEYI